MTLQASPLVPSFSRFCSLYRSSQCLLLPQVITQLHPTKTFCEHNVWMPGKENWEHTRQQNMGAVNQCDFSLQAQYSNKDYSQACMAKFNDHYLAGGVCMPHLAIK